MPENISSIVKIVLLLTCISVLVTSENTDCEVLCSCQFTETDIKVKCAGRNVTDVPEKLPTNTTKLYLSGTGIHTVRARAFYRYPRLTELFFRDTSSNPCELEYLEAGVFDGLKQLEALGMIGCGKLTKLDAGVLGTFYNLETLQIYRSGLTSVPDLSQFQTINPDMEGVMKEIDFHNNKIEIIHTMAFYGVKTDTLKLEENLIASIASHAFTNATIVNLRLNKNEELRSIEEHAFDGIVLLQKLDLSFTSITTLPTLGLNQIRELVLKGTPSLKQFPSVLEFSKIERAELFYPHHCCAFKNPEKQNPEAWKTKQAQEMINRQCALTTTPLSIQPIDNQQFSSLHPPLPVETGELPFPLDRMSTMINNIAKFRSKRDDFGSFDVSLTTNETDRDENTQFETQKSSQSINGFGLFKPQNKDTDNDVNERESNIQFHKSTLPVDKNVTQNVFCGELYVYNRNVTCTPEPDAFNPCEDVMGYEWLRVIVWFVLLAALLGNSVVLIVLITSRGKFTVPKFLMCNLAFADLLMGVYLILLASIDIHTLGEYFNYAVEWQNEGGCQAAGFLSVFSSELSIFTLTILTLERWYAISHAIHLNKRLKLRQSLALMVFGYVFASILALLPLVGISGYGNVSICLPMKADNGVDIGYVVSLLIMNGLMFLAICSCYVNMYCKVKGSGSTARSNDATIAKRMALLVFTNFACWAPIAFFGLTASAGAPLIDITHSKILLVFFYPLNSCVNPFLYSILTKQFRKDAFILLGKYGICVEKANMYRGTHTSRTLSQSRGVNKDVNIHFHRHSESLFTHLVDSNNSSKHSVNSTPKIYPTHRHSETHPFIVEKSHLDRAAEFANRDPILGEEPCLEAWRTTGNQPDITHPPYVRSVSDYMTFNIRKNSSNKTTPRGRKSTETFVSCSTDTTYISDTSHGTEDIWQLREKDDDCDIEQVDEYLDDTKINSKTVPSMLYSSADEMRISHKNCYTVSSDMDFDDKNDVNESLISREVTFRNQIFIRSPVKLLHSCSSNSSNRYKFARSPSLSSLEENVEMCMSARDQLRRPSSGSLGNDIDTQYMGHKLKADKSKESGFHSSTSLQRDVCL